MCAMYVYRLKLKEALIYLLIKIELNPHQLFSLLITIFSLLMNSLLSFVIEDTQFVNTNKLDRIWFASMQNFSK